ncbi:hypothetical protein AB1N83_008136 [Pleurotus pulmonarius]
MIVNEKFSAWVEIEGVAAQEYNAQVKEDGKHDISRSSCWIPSEEGKAFSVHIKDASCTIDTCWVVRVDGVKIGSIFLQPPYRGECERTSCLKTVRVSHTEQRGLIFSKINVTDDEEYLTHTTHHNLGEITLDVWTARYAERTVPALFVQLPNEPVHEKSKKSGTHCIGLGASEQVESTEDDTAHLWNRIKHLATFSFKYRPLELLQANGIVPAPPPVPAPEEDDAEAEEELKGLKRQMEVMQERLAQLEKSRGAKRVRAEPDVAERRTRKRVKVEPKSTFVPGELIDLTSD